MTCEQCTFSQEQVADSSQTSSLDIPPWLQLNGNHTPAKSLENEQPMAGSLTCECGKGTSECLIHPSTPDKWIAFMRDSLAKTLAKLENRPVLVKEPAAGFTEKSCVLLAQLDPDSYSWKMSQQLKATALKRLSKTWPSWGMTVDGCAYAHPMSGQIITETDGFAYLATPTTKANQLAPSMMKHPSCVNLVNAMLPTPTAHNAKKGAYPAEGERKTPSLAWILGGKINPQFTEWMMGWPINYTALRQLETVKSRSKSRQRLPSWLRNK